MIPQNKNVHQLVWYLWYIDTAVEDSQVYCYNTKGNINSVVSQASCIMDVTRLEQRAYNKIAVLQGKNVKEYHSELIVECVPASMVLVVLRHYIRGQGVLLL